MKKIIAVIKKDIILQSRNFMELLIAIGLAIVIIILFSFSESTDLTIGVESSLKEDINYNEQIGGVVINFMDSDIIVKTEFHDKGRLDELLQDNNYPLIIYTDSNELSFKLNSRDPQATTTYLLLSRYFNGVEEDNFNTEYIASGSNTIIMLVISFAFIFGGASRGSTVLFQEKKNGTLNLLYKSGLSSFAIVLSKLIFTILIMIFILLGIGLFGYLTDYLNIFTSLTNVLFLIYILIPISILGNFIGIISKTVEESRSYQVILFIPSMFYLSLVNKIPTSYQFLLRLHPGIAVTHFYERILDGYFDTYLFTAISVISALMFTVNVLILRRLVEKSM